jgi:CheY-like chemotaxis protein
MHACRLLSVGYDPILMPVRSMLLHQAGYEVVEARSLVEALKRIKAANTDLLLICHSVNEDERYLMIEASRLSSPLVPFFA